MTVIFIVNAVIISIPTPGRSRKTPSDNGTAVTSGIEQHDSTANVSNTKVRLNTHTNGTYCQSLTNCQLHAEYENTLICQQDKVMDQECNCKELKTGILLLLPLALQPAMGFGLSNNTSPFGSIYHQLSPSFNFQHLQISSHFFSPSFLGSFSSSRSFQFLCEDLFGHPILLHSLQMTQSAYPLPLYRYTAIFILFLTAHNEMKIYQLFCSKL
jgi:hypothetical protein